MKDLNELRARSAYPAFRFLCSVLWLIALAGGALAVIWGLVVMTAIPLAGLGILVGAAISVFLAKVTVEASLMLVDIADCTLDNWRGRRAITEASAPRPEDAGGSGIGTVSTGS